MESSTASHCCWTPAVVVTTGVVPALSQYRYAVYNITFTVTNPTTTIIVSSVTLGSYVTGYYTTESIDVGTEITSWGLFNSVRTLDDGTIDYQVQSSNDGVMSEGGWTPQALDAAITVPIRRYVAARMTFGTNASTALPILDNLTFNWNDGEDPPDPKGITYKDSYYLFFATNAAAGQVNKNIAVLNRNNAIDLYGGIHVGGAAIYDNNLLVGDAEQTGYVYSMFTSTDGSDFTNHVESQVTFKRIDGGVPDAYKIFDRLYITISRDNVDVSQIWGVTYSVDGSTSWHTANNIELSTGTKLDVLKAFFPQESVREGRYIDIKIAELTRRTYPYHIHRMKLYGTIEDVE